MGNLLILRAQELLEGHRSGERAVVKGDGDDTVGDVVDLVVTPALRGAGADGLTRGVHGARAVAVSAAGRRDGAVGGDFARGDCGSEGVGPLGRDLGDGEFSDGVFGRPF